MGKARATTYESGIVVPPKFECVCGIPGCRIDEHHNAFDGPYYKKAPGIRREASRFIIQEFRNSVYNRFWIPRCKHEELHAETRSVRRPKLEIVQGFVEEAGVLRRLDEAAVGLNWSARRIGNWSERRDRRRLEELLERRSQLEQKHETALTEVGSIQIIPEEVVTGALLFSAPDVARQRLLESPDQGIVATRSWPKHHILDIAFLGREALPLQTEVDRVELAA